MELIFCVAEVSLLEVKETMTIQELNDLELTAIGGGCAESTPY